MVAVWTFEIAPSGYPQHILIRSARARGRNSGALRDAGLAGRWLLWWFDAGRGGTRRAVIDQAAGGGVDTAPNRRVTVRAAGGRISKVIVRTDGDPVVGRLNAARTVWRSTWALNVSQRYTVTATATGTSGNPVTRTSSFRTFTPRNTFSTRVVEGYRQTYGVGMLQSSVLQPTDQEQTRG